MYKVNYFITAKEEDGSASNIMQSSDIWYTNIEIEEIPKELPKVLNSRRGDDKYLPVITNIERIKGHL